MKLKYPILKNPQKLLFREIPFWEGIQNKPGIRKTIPFSLEIPKGGGPIQQGNTRKVFTKIFRMYKSKKYNLITPAPGSSKWANSRAFEKIQFVKWGLKKKSPKKILEIGGGSAWIANQLVKIYKPEKYVLIDPAIKTKSNHVKIVKDFYPSKKIKNKIFDLIIGFSVIEHVPNPSFFLKSIRSQLSRNGKVLLYFPESERQLKNGDLNVLCHEHKTYFTENSFRNISLKNGLQILKIKKKNDVIFAVLKKCKPNKQIKNTNEVNLLRRSMQAFQTTINKYGSKIKKYLASGEKIGFHGATNGLNNFIYLSGLVNHPGIKIYDGDISRRGMFLPSCQAPLLSPSDASYKKNMVLVVSAMSFFSEIKKDAIKKHGMSSGQIYKLEKFDLAKK